MHDSYTQHKSEDEFDSFLQILLNTIFPLKMSLFISQSLDFESFKTIRQNEWNKAKDQRTQNVIY